MVVAVFAHPELVDKGDDLEEHGTGRDKREINLNFYLRKGNDLHEQEKYEDAIAVYEEALAIKPDLGPAHHNCGNALMAMGRYSEAIASYRAAVCYIPSFSEGYVTMATALMALHKPYEAMACCYRALAIDPRCAEAHWNLALTLLQVGEYQTGWQEFEWRWKKRGFTSRERTFDQPIWDGTPLCGRTILIHAEQGFGDTIQFARFIPLVAERGGRVILECPAPLAKLMESVQGVEWIIPAGESLPGFDVHLPLMSLPRVFETSLESIPQQVPYILPPLDSLAKWTEKFSNTENLRVGIVWAGRKRPDPNRTCPFENFAPLADISGVSFYSLQIENEMSGRCGETQVLDLNDFTAEIRDFSDTAAIIAHLDLVISIDTGVAHLSGALGKETWVLLPHAADWRWMLDRNDSPWYPGMRLFRQDQPGEWQGIIVKLQAALSARVNCERSAVIAISAGFKRY